MLGRGPLAHGEEVDELDEEPRVALTALTHRLHQLPEAGDEPVVADAEQGPAPDVPDAGGLDDEHAGPPLGEARVPRQHLGGPPRRPRWPARELWPAPTCAARRRCDRWAGERTSGSARPHPRWASGRAAGRGGSGGALGDRPTIFGEAHRRMRRLCARTWHSE